jgi:hypothetical protein
VPYCRLTSPCVAAALSAHYIVLDKSPKVTALRTQGSWASCRWCPSIALGKLRIVSSRSVWVTQLDPISKKQSKTKETKELTMWEVRPQLEAESPAPGLWDVWNPISGWSQPSATCLTENTACKPNLSHPSSSCLPWTLSLPNPHSSSSAPPSLPWIRHGETLETPFSILGNMNLAGQC